MDPNQADAGKEQLWTALDVAHFLQVSRATVYNLANRCELPVSRIGALLRFVPTAVRAFAEASRAPATVVQLKQIGPRKKGASSS